MPRRLSTGPKQTRVLGAAAPVFLALVFAIAPAHPSGAAELLRANSVPIGGPPGPEGVPLEVGRLLAPVTGSAKGNTVDGVECDASEQVVYHVHTHLAVYVNGVLRPIPAGIGLAQPAIAEETNDGPFWGATNCYYRLHVHAQDGVIHIESPTQRSYTLGQFFAIWRQPLNSQQVATARGRLTVWVNGNRYAGNPANIPLGSHEDIQIDVGTPIVPPKTINWSLTQL